MMKDRDKQKSASSRQQAADHKEEKRKDLRILTYISRFGRNHRLKWPPRSGYGRRVTNSQELAEDSPSLILKLMRFLTYILPFGSFIGTVDGMPMGVHLNLYYLVFTSSILKYDIFCRKNNTINGKYNKNEVVVYSVVEEILFLLKIKIVILI